LPHERVFSNLRYAPSNFASPDLANEIVFGSPAPLDLAPVTLPANYLPGPALGSSPVPFYLPGGGGGGGSTPPVTVPEPATWGMFLLGMLLMGPGLRSAQHRRAQGKPACEFSDSRSGQP